ncbi:kinase-like domain-containing protein, partial [Pestalotiopsis sp. NC0098]
EDSTSHSDVTLPGILDVRLIKDAGLSVPDRHLGLFDDHQLRAPDQATASRWNTNSELLSCLPYAVLELNKSQVILRTYKSSFQGRTWFPGPIKFDVFQTGELIIRVYLAIPGDPGPGICLGSGRVIPPYTITGSSTKWLPVAGGTGKLLVKLEYKANPAKLYLEDFDTRNLISLQGAPGISGVFLAKSRHTERLYAVKTMRKSRKDSSFRVPQGIRYGAPLFVAVDSDFIFPLYTTFQEPEKFSLIVPFASGGHLFYYLQREHHFDTNKAKFYAAEMICAVQYLHKRDIVCEGLWPGNILLDSLGHVILADFSLHHSGTGETRDAVRLLEFPAPELLLGQVHGKAVDWWTLGVFLYEMLTGMPPFYAKNTEEVHRNIVSEPIQPLEMLDMSTNDLLLGLLKRNPDLRLGANGASEVQDHAFFHNINWQRLLGRQVEPPFKPTLDPGEVMTMRFEDGTYRYPPRKESGQGEAWRPWRTYECAWSAGLGEDDEVFKKFHPPGLFARLIRTSDGSLLHAVIQGDYAPVINVVKDADRVSKTQALGLAVEKRDPEMIRILLDHGASCDFDDSDRPRPSLDNGCCFGRDNGVEEAADFLPPLVRAVKLHDVESARMLLAAGADPDVGFHDNKRLRIYDPDSNKPLIDCGRVIQLASAYDDGEMVQLLLASGASIGRPAPEWHHACEPIERTVYLTVTAHLRKNLEEYRAKASG